MSAIILFGSDRHALLQNKKHKGFVSSFIQFHFEALAVVIKGNYVHFDMFFKGC